MGMHRYLWMRKVLQANISSAEFLSIPTTTKFTKSVKYIHDDKSWGKCYVLLNIIFPCLKVLRLEDSNLALMDKVYYYSIMKNQCIEKKESDHDYQRVFPDISSPASIWNMYDVESDEEESISNDFTLYSENICFVISKLWNKSEEHINTNYVVTGWMLCVISHIRKDLFKNAQNINRIQVNNFIKTFYAGSTEKELPGTLDTFWSEYTLSNHNNDPFDSNEFI